MEFFFHPISSLNHFTARITADKVTFWISVIFFFYISLNYKNNLWEAIDNIASEWIKNLENKFLNENGEKLSIFGNAIPHILFSLILSLVLFFIEDQKAAGFSVLFTLIFSWGLNRGLKLIFKRERPAHIGESIKKRISYCFPSGHVMASIPIYFFSSMFLQNMIPFIPWYIVSFILCFFVVVTRLYLNHHYFSDVLAGIALGFVCLNISIWFYYFLWGLG